MSKVGSEQWSESYYCLRSAALSLIVMHVEPQANIDMENTTVGSGQNSAIDMPMPGHSGLTNDSSSSTISLPLLTTRLLGFIINHPIECHNLIPLVCFLCLEVNSTLLAPKACSVCKMYFHLNCLLESTLVQAKVCARPYVYRITKCPPSPIFRI